MPPIRRRAASRSTSDARGAHRSGPRAQSDRLHQRARHRDRGRRRRRGRSDQRRVRSRRQRRAGQLDQVAARPSARRRRGARVRGGASRPRERRSRADRLSRAAGPGLPRAPRAAARRAHRAAARRDVQLLRLRRLQRGADRGARLMAETTIRTLVCSVMFLDIVDYSKRSVGDQQHMKQTFNELLARALEPVPPRDFIVLDTGDGAAIAFLGDPEDALSAGIAVRKSIASLPPEMLSARMGINVAQRVMSFAKPGQLLASRSFYEVVSRLSRDYASLFSDLGTRTDKHVREHEVYAVAEGARLERPADTPRRSRGPRSSDPDETNLDLFSTEDSPIVEHAAKKARREKSTAEPARIFEAGANLIVSGSSKAAVEQALERLSKGGAEVISHITQVGDKWMASCTNPKVNVAACKVEVAGLMRIITGPTREAVDEKVRDLVQFGAVLVSDIELNDGVWTAVCDTGGRSR